MFIFSIVTQITPASVTLVQRMAPASVIIGMGRTTVLVEMIELAPTASLVSKNTQIQCCL